MTRLHVIEGPPRVAPPGPCALQQHPRYGTAITALSGRVAHLRDEQASALILRRKLGPLPVCWLPRGPVTAPGSDRSEAIARILVHLPRGLRLAQPDGAGDIPAHAAAGYRPLLAPPQVAELDLTASRAVRMAAQDGKWRNRLRRALEGPLDITHRPFDPAMDTALLTREEAQRRARRYRALPARFTLAYAATAKGAARVFLAFHRGELAGFVLMLLHPPVATYHIGWSGAAGRAHGAHPLLLWRAADWLAEAGFVRLDLGAVDMRAAPGLARFKLGFGARARPLGPTLVHLPRLIPARRAA